MITLLIFLVVAIITILLSFAVTFTVVSLFISWKRRDIPKYCYSQPAEPQSLKHDTMFDIAPAVSQIDGHNAVGEWNTL